MIISVHTLYIYIQHLKGALTQEMFTTKNKMSASADLFFHNKNCVNEDINFRL